MPVARFEMWRDYSIRRLSTAYPPDKWTIKMSVSIQKIGCPLRQPIE